MVKSEYQIGFGGEHPPEFDAKLNDEQITVNLVVIRGKSGENPALSRNCEEKKL